MTGLYIHIPFCHDICTYCDFAKTVAKPKRKHAYINRLVKEIALSKESIKDVGTIYIGGGTPSSLALNDLSHVLATIQKTVDLDGVSEYTIECNPEDISTTFIETIKDYGINRVSLGVQSFDNRILTKMRRTHNTNMIDNALSLLRKHRINNVSIDLIFAYPGQTLKMVLNDLDQAIKYEVNHLSYYALILEDKTILNHQVTHNQERVIDEETEALMYTKVREKLIDAGYAHYEISNFAKPGYTSKHNMLYWTDQNYIGLGVGAHSYVYPKRYYHTRNIQQYLEASEDYSDVIFEEASYPLQDACMMGLRLTRGLYVPEINAKYKIDLFRVFPDINHYIDQGLVVFENDYLRLTNQGRLLGNNVFSIFVEGSHA
ncbi:MAG: radical SAM family heme chaperone HemW [Candidatus Izemoplasma sp.]|nr:radical SAM family heme chaperone HemW [Candidatus Izemoplasma sp.]